MDIHRFWIGYIIHDIAHRAFHVSDLLSFFLFWRKKIPPNWKSINLGPARNGPTKRTPGRLPRIPFTPYQLNELETAYSQTNYLSSEDANKLAGRLELTCIRVKIWFQNRRARERREKRESELRSSSPSSPPQLEIPAVTTHHYQSMISSSGLWHWLYQIINIIILFL